MSSGNVSRSSSSEAQRIQREQEAARIAAELAALAAQRAAELASASAKKDGAGVSGADGVDGQPIHHGTAAPGLSDPHADWQLTRPLADDAGVNAFMRDFAKATPVGTPLTRGQPGHIEGLIEGLSATATASKDPKATVQGDVNEQVQWLQDSACLSAADARYVRQQVDQRVLGPHAATEKLPTEQPPPQPQPVGDLDEARLREMQQEMQSRQEHPYGDNPLGRFLEQLTKTWNDTNRQMTENLKQR